MSKTHFLKNKELVAVIIATCVILVMIAINCVLLIPSLTGVYLNKEGAMGKSPIDIQTVSEAVRILQE
jgi:hypothetical protein